VPGGFGAVGSSWTCEAIAGKPRGDNDMGSLAEVIAMLMELADMLPQQAQQAIQQVIEILQGISGG
jgi:hypothetical protein